MKILILVPDGVTVRNYFYSDFCKNLIKSGYKIVVYHNLSKAAVLQIKKHQKEISEFYKIPVFVENPKARLLRESIVYARILRNSLQLKNSTILKFWSPNKKGIKKKGLYFLSEAIGFFLSKSYKLIVSAEAYFNKEIKKNTYTSFISKKIIASKPDVILNLNPKSPITSPFITAGNFLGIITATIIISWDNVPKARLISRYNYYFVWSTLMKKELNFLYPEILENQVKVTGTPQFDFYFNKNYFKSKEMFFKEFGLDTSKKTICYSSNDISFLYEPNYLEDICEAVSKIEETLRPQIIFRRNPVDKTNRFDKVIEKYKDIITSIDPDWKLEGKNTFTSIYPTLNDSTLLVNTIRYSDIIINLGSTMAHDAAVLNKPCLYLNYNPVNNPFLRVEDIYKYEHFKSMKGLKAVEWINSKEMIFTKIIETLKDASSVSVDNQKWLQKIVCHPVNKSSDRFIGFLEEISNFSKNKNS